MWSASTLAIIVCFTMWFFNDGEAFHPHSVDVDHRHSTFVVVNSETVCKYDCTIKSISAFVAPRGSSSSKVFSSLCVIISIAGILGSARWHQVGDASELESNLACFGFAALLLVAFFELDVVPERFLDDKLMVTSWLIQKLKRKEKLPFSLHFTSPGLLEFVRQSPGLYPLFEEDLYLIEREAKGAHNMSSYHTMWFGMHLIGATAFAACCTAAILLNDIKEESVAWIVAFTFCTFGAMGYMTGGYYPHHLPVLKIFRGWILVWNPFLREPHFMLKLSDALDEFQRKHKILNVEQENHQDGNEGRSSSPLSGDNESCSGTPSRKSRKSRKSLSASLTQSLPTNTTTSSATESTTAVRRKIRSSRKSNSNTSADASGGTDASATTKNKRRSSLKLVQAAEEEKSRWWKLQSQEEIAADEIDEAALDSVFLRFARSDPRLYLQVTGYMMVMTELIALLTPIVAMGLQWVTALCDGPVYDSVIELLSLSIACARDRNCSAETFTQNAMHHCIIKQ